jgi:N-acetylglucosamine-6-sulfatase
MIVAASVMVAALVTSISLPAHAQLAGISLDPTHGPIGATVTITGTGLSGTTAVSFAGVAATFTVVDDGHVTTTVPSGASTGAVHIDTPDGSLTSDPFTVQPNIVVILTDDQRWDSLPLMPTVQSELVNHGATFANMFVEDPICCPSRASFLTGWDAHTTGVFNNDPPYGGFAAFDDGASLATWLDAAGYETFLTGKYLNHYPSTKGLYEPPGWDVWRAFATTNAYFNYNISIDGTGVQSYGSAPEDYSTDVIAGLAQHEIETASPQDPLFMWIAPLAPHGTWIPAPRDVGSLDGIAPWRPPNYDEPDVRDKPAYMQALPRLSTDAMTTIDTNRQASLETLGAVDDLVGTTVQALRDTGRLDDTIVVYASDNGYLWGEHRRTGKSVPYEESIRVPLVIRWDRLGSAPGVDGHFVQNTDLAPTLVQAAGASSRAADGQSLLPLLTGQARSWRRHMLIEHAGPGAPAYCADRTANEIFVHYATGEEEYYRLGAKGDPYERTNQITAARWQTRIAFLRDKLRTMCTPLPPGLPAF